MRTHAIASGQCCADAIPAALVHALPHLKWRRHGVGMIQAYLRESDDGVEHRVHIWHPELLRSGITDHGDIHNHRFDMTSVVLVGSIRHVECLISNPGPEWDAYEVVHARAGNAMDLVESCASGPIGVTAMTFRAGEAYFFPRGAYHQSVPLELAVTVISKSNQTPDKARVLARHGEPFVMAMDPDEHVDFDRYVNMAIEALLKCG